MLRIPLAAGAIGAAALFSAPEQAEAGTVGIAPSGVTTVEVTAPLGVLRLGGAPVGTATALGCGVLLPDHGRVDRHRDAGRAHRT